MLFLIPILVVAALVVVLFVVVVVILVVVVIVVVVELRVLRAAVHLCSGVVRLALGCGGVFAYRVRADPISCCTTVIIACQGTCRAIS